MNPFSWLLELFDQLDEMEGIAFAVYVAAVMLTGLATHAYEEMSSLLILVAVGSLLALPGTLVVRAILEFLSQLFESIMP